MDILKDFARTSLSLMEIRGDLWKLTIYWSLSLAPFVFTIGALTVILFPTLFEDIPPPSGCRKLGLKRGSNLEDEHLTQESDDSQNVKLEESRRHIKVKSLWIYPVKGCQGIELHESDFVTTGLKYDRQFSIARLHTPRTDASNPDVKPKPEWRFITQREAALMSQIRTELWLPDRLAAGYDPSSTYVSSGGAIIITFPHPCSRVSGFLRKLTCKILGTKPVKSAIFPFAPTEAQIEETKYTVEPFKIWKDTPQALNMGVHLPTELKKYLGLKDQLTLFRVTNLREVYRCAPRKETLGWQPTTGFADAYPVNLLGIASVHALSAMQPPLSATLSAKRFRPNIIVEGAAAFDEDEWTKIRIGKNEFFVVCRCVRCKVPNVDLVTGIRDINQPYRTLTSKREIDRGAKGLGCLGMQMVAARQEGNLRVGDAVEVLETGDHEYIKQ